MLSKQLPDSTIANYLASVGQILSPLDAPYGRLVEDLSVLAERLKEVHRNGGRVYVCGNGGSAANAAHLTLHLRDRKIRAFDLGADVPWVTATANDYGYERIFSMALHALDAGTQDLLVVISGSGDSENILAGLEIGAQRGLPSWGLLGMGGGKAAGLCTGTVIVDSDAYGIIEDVHSIAIHALAKTLQLPLSAAS